MKTLIRKNSLPLMAALFVIGTVTGILMLYGYQLHERSTHVLANAAPSAQQPAPMADMPKTPAKDTQTPKPQDAGPMPGMPENNNSGSAGEGQKAVSASPGQNVAPGTVMLDPASQQLINVRYTEVRRTDMKRTLRTVGLVQMDEEKISKVHVKFAGWIEKVYLDYVGKLVRKGQPLFTLYSPELVSSQQEYLIALKGQEYLSKAPYADAASGADSLLRATRDRLQLLDITDAQIRALEATGKAQRTMTVYSPISGFVMNRNAFEQAYVTPETALYDIADLSTIWVYVDIFEYEAPYVRVGQLGSMQLSYFPGKTYSGRVTYVYPTLDPKTRTIKVRLEFPNPKFELKPEMYADVQVAIDYGSQIVVPSEAVLNSGTGQFVFIAKPGGYFEPREIKVGDQFDGQYVVLAGLKPGEKIVASGNFLIDSESRLGSAMQGMAGMQGKPPAKQ
ncbi:MAG: efflux RND transporter periplasmic adaptor subunit [Candidatus Acidiferrum sp.]